MFHCRRFDGRSIAPALPALHNSHLTKASRRRIAVCMLENLIMIFRDATREAVDASVVRLCSQQRTSSGRIRITDSAGNSLSVPRYRNRLPQAVGWAKGFWLLRSGGGTPRKCSVDRSLQGLMGHVCGLGFHRLCGRPLNLPDRTVCHPS